MYTLIDAVGNAEEEARGAALEDRMRYAKFMQCAERFAVDNGLIASGPHATRLLLGSEKEPLPVALDSFQYEFYSGRAVPHARALGDALYAADPQGLGHYTTVKTKIEDYRFVVEVDGRDLVTITALPVYRGVRTADVLVPLRRPAQFAVGPNGPPLALPCAGPDIQLLAVYSALCNPAEAGKWGALLGTEADLRRLFGPAMRTKIDRLPASGGAEDEPPNEPGKRLRQALFTHYVPGPGRVLIGPLAVALLTGAREPGRAGGDASRPQVVSVGSVEADTREIAALGERVKVEVQWDVHDPKIPGDMRMRRLTVYAVVAGRREPVMNVYNSAEHELIPFLRVKNKHVSHDKKDAHYKIGTPFVLLRFRLVDMWIIQVLLRMGKLQQPYAKSMLRSMLADYETVAAHYEKLLTSGVPDLPARLMPTEDYIGRLEDLELAMKRKAEANTRFFPPYMPAARREPTDHTTIEQSRTG
jgi:hypothetical protein